jgi:serralysin
MAGLEVNYTPAVETSYLRTIDVSADSGCKCVLCAGQAVAANGSEVGALQLASPSSASALPYYVSALLPSNTPRWNSASSVGTAVNVTYSFMTQLPSYVYSSDHDNFVPMSAAQKTAVRAALATWADVANITFSEVSDAGSGGLIRFGTDSQNKVSSGYARYPSSEPDGGDVYIANDDYNNTYPSSGDNGFLTLVHEIGHAVGLKHPGNYNAGGGGTEGPYLPYYEDTYRYSVMSYHKQSSYDYDALAAAPALFDVAAIQYLYGANTSVRSGDNTYTFSDTTSPFTKVIWDGGGIDTINASAQTVNIEIDLTPGSFSSIGVDDTYYWYASSATDNVSIAYGADIENAIGGSGYESLFD